MAQFFWTRSGYNKKSHPTVFTLWIDLSGSELVFSDDNCLSGNAGSRESEQLFFSGTLACLEDTVGNPPNSCGFLTLDVKQTVCNEHMGV